LKIKFFTLFTKQKYNADEEIFINRGPRSNNDLLRLYGYILNNNEANIAFINANLKKTDPYYKIKESILNQHNLWSPPFPYGDASNGLWVKKQIPLHVVAYFRILFWRPTTRQLKDFDDSGKIPSLNPNKLIDDENEKQAIQELVKAIEDAINKYPESFKEDKALLEKGNLTPVEQTAITVRYQEKRALNEARNTLMRPLTFEKNIV